MNAAADLADGLQIDGSYLPLPGETTIAKCALYDFARQAEIVEAAERTGSCLILVLTTMEHVWLVDPMRETSCLACFQLWMRGWYGATSTAVSDVLPTPDWVMADLLEAEITLFAKGAARGSPAFRQFDVKRLLAEDREVAAHPECALCCKNSGTPIVAHDLGTLPQRQSIFDAAAKIMPHLASTQTELVHRIQRRSSGAFQGAAVASVRTARRPLEIDHGYGRTGLTGHDRSISVLEALERYLCHLPAPTTHQIRASFEDIEGEAVDPVAYILPAKPSPLNPRLSYRPDVTYDWTEAFSVRRGRLTWVPTQLAYHGLNSTVLAGGRFAQETSSGCAIGRDVAEAAFYGLLEIIERDAFLSRWYGRAPVDEIRPDQIDDDQIRGTLARLQAEGIRTAILDIRSGLNVGSVAVELHDPERQFGHALIYGAAAHPDSVSAIRSALCEASSSLRTLTAENRAAVEIRARELLDDPALVRTMPDHVDQGQALEAVSRRLPRTGATVEVSMSSETQPRDFFALAQQCLNLCDDILVVDLSREPFTRTGLRCVKVLAPGLLPMTFGHTNARISADRLARVPGAVPIETVMGGAAFAPHIFG